MKKSICGTKLEFFKYEYYVCPRHCLIYVRFDILLKINGNCDYFIGGIGKMVFSKNILDDFRMMYQKNSHKL